MSQIRRPSVFLGLRNSGHRTPTRFAGFGPHLAGFGPHLADFRPHTAVKPHFRVLLIIHDRSDPSCKVAPLGGVHGLPLAVIHGYALYVPSSGHIPIPYRRAANRPTPIDTRRVFSWHRNLLSYEHVWGHGLARSLPERSSRHSSSRLSPRLDGGVCTGSSGDARG